MNETLTKFAPLAGTFLLGLLARLVWDKYQNRISQITYNVKHSFLGISGEDKLYGSVSLLYNQTPVQNLYISTMVIRNESQRDLTDVELNVYGAKEDIFLVSYGIKSNSVKPINYADEFTELMKSSSQRITNQRDYLVPVFNRRETIEISCLITNSVGAQPLLGLTCDHKGIKVVYKTEPQSLFWGESQALCAWWGLLISGIFLFPAIYYLKSGITIGIISFLLGAFLIIPGAVLVKIAKKVSNIFS